MVVAKGAPAEASVVNGLDATSGECFAMADAILTRYWMWWSCWWGLPEVLMRLADGLSHGWRAKRAEQNLESAGGKCRDHVNCHHVHSPIMGGQDWK